MKKVILMLLCVMTIFGVVGCGKENANNTGSTNVTNNNSNNAATNSTTKQQDTLANENNSDKQDNKTNSDKKVAVVFFSGTGNTKEVADLIADVTNADIFQIVPEVEYTSDDLNYNDDNCRANKEMNDDTARPAIANDLSAITDYEVIYLGYPIWWGTAPRIIQTFIESYNMSNSTIYTFCTSGGSSIDRSVSDLQTKYPDVNIVSGKRLNNATKSDIEQWVNELQ